MMETMVQWLGLELNGPTIVFGDNWQVVMNASIPSSTLKNRHMAIAYHYFR